MARRTRRELLRAVTTVLALLPAAGLVGCTGADALADLASTGLRGRIATAVPAVPAAEPDLARAATGHAEALATPAPTPGPDLDPAASAAPGPPGPVLTVSVPATPTPVPPTPIPTPTPRPRPRRALLNVPYYSQHVGRQNYCLPTSIAMLADRYDRLPDDISGTPDRAPRFIADVAYRLARERIAAFDESGFKELWEEIGTDPLGGRIWDVFAPNGRDLAYGMSPALAYLVLTFAFDLRPTLGTLEACLVALADDVPSVLFGDYAPLRRADGQPPNVGGYAGPHAFVLVGVDEERALINDPLPSDKLAYSGRRERHSALQRAVRFDLASVRRMTLGNGGLPRGDCFMMYPATGGAYPTPAG